MFFTVLTLFLLSGAAGLVGLFLFLKHRTLEVDVLVHSVFPGVAAAFIVAHTRELSVMIVGGVIASLCALLCVRLLRGVGVPQDSSLGMTATTFFSIGVILISFIPSVDIDPNCVLFGAMEFLSFDLVDLFGFQIPRGTAHAGAVFILTAFLVMRYKKELVLYSFDETYSRMQGVPNRLIECILVFLVSLISITSFHIAGTVLVLVHMAVLPLIGRLCSSTMSCIIAIEFFVAVVSATVGALMSEHLNLSSAPMSAAITLFCVFVALLFSPQHGVFFSVIKSQWVKILIARDDVLAKLYRDHELGARHFALKETLYIKLGKMLALFQGLVTRESSGALTLSLYGRERGEMLIRSHRLWELYLHTSLHQEKERLHGSSDRMEHFISKDVSNSLSETLDETVTDPHGRKIP